MKKDSNKQTLADRDWWREWGRQFGWTLYGFSYRDEATFFLRSKKMLDITDEIKRDIDGAIEARRV